MVEQANAENTVCNKSCGNIAVMGGWRSIIEGPLFKTDSKVYNCYVLVLGPEKSSLLNVHSFFFTELSFMTKIPKLELFALVQRGYIEKKQIKP